MTDAVLIVAGVAALVLGTALACMRRMARAAAVVQALGAAAIAVGGFAVAVSGDSVGSGFSNGISPTVGVDPLSGFFLGVVGVVAVATLAYSCTYLEVEASPRGVAVAGGLFVLAMVGVLVARDAVGFLACWELMTLAPAASIALHSRSDESLRALLTYLALTHLAAAAVWVVMLALANAGALSTPGALAGVPSWERTLLALGALVGFGTKAGLAPLHTWLPRAHPAAPANMSALMSGVMIKVAMYGLVRALFWWIDPLPQWVAPALLIVALVSCIAGVTYALLQQELKRMLAFSSIENVGIVALGLATSLLAARAGHPAVAALAFAAALLHTLNHALFKSLLFLCAGSFQRGVGTLELDRLGGLLRSMPVTGAAFLVGSMSIAGVPPFNGFASEWLTFQGLLQLAIAGDAGSLVAGVVGAAALAATAALAVFCFVKAIGFVLLGTHRTGEAAAARDVARWMTVPQAALAGACVALGVVPSLALASMRHASPYGALASSSSLRGLGTAHTGGFRPLAVALVIAIVVGGLQVARTRARRTAPSPMWNCGQDAHPRLAWTPAGFTKSLRLVLAVVLRPRREVEVEREHGEVVRVTHRAALPYLFDEWLYRPVITAATSTGRALLALQSGSLRVYLAYLVVTILVALAAVRLAVGA